jgi:hypothetical protein
MDLTEIWMKVVDQIHVAKGSDLWWAVVNTVIIHLRVP